MNRSHYYFGIFLIILQVCISLFQSIIYQQLGWRINTLPSLVPWYVFTLVIYFTGSFIILKYFYFKSFKVAYLFSIISLLATCFQYIIMYNAIVNRKLEEYYFTALYIVLITTIIYSVSLILSNAAKRPWLKAAGVYSLILGVLLIFTLAGVRNFQDMPVKVTLEKVQQWASWAGIFVPIFFIINFLSELRQEDRSTSQNKSLNILLLLASIIILISTLVFGQKIASESILAGYPQIIGEKAKGIASKFEAGHYVNSQGDTMRYRLMKPVNYDPRKRYPLVVLLHHGGAHGTDNVIQVEASFAPFLSNYNNIRNYQAFLFVPQAPPGKSFITPSIDLLIFETINVLEKEFAIDTKRRYVMGLSGGGYGSWSFIANHPKMFAAAIPMCGGGNTGYAKNMVDVAVWAFHGETDELAPVSGSREMIAAIKNAGGKPRYTEFPNTGHDIWKQVQSTPGLLDWLFSQRRE